MKYKKIMWLYAIVAPVAVLLRTFQVVFTTASNGFTYGGYKELNYKITVAVIAALMVLAVVGFLTHRCPPKKPRVTLQLGTASAVFAIAVIVDALLLTSSSVVPAWQELLVRVLGIACGLLFAAYSVSGIFKYTIPPISFAVAVMDWVARVVCAFTSFNTLKFTMGHIFLMVAYCSVLLFMLELAKMMNGLDKEYGFKKLLAFGILSSTFCAMVSVPYMAARILGRSAGCPESFKTVILMFVTAVFITVFIIVHFSEKNLRHRHRRHRSHTKVLNIEARVDHFYTGN